MDQRELIRLAAALAQPLSLGSRGSSATVASALLTAAGNVYTGVCIDLRCGLGFCAERAAAAEMLKRRETTVRMLVAVDSKGEIVSPCGVCREFLIQLEAENARAVVVLGLERATTLGELLP